MGKRINVKRDENGNEVRSKRSKQISKEDLELAIEKFDNDKKKISEYFNIKEWSLREQLKKYNLNYDKRADSNKERKITIPPKEELKELYFIRNMTLLDIGKFYKISNVTVKKWFVHYNIELLSHKDTIIQKVIPKIEDFNVKKYGEKHFFGTKEGMKKVKDSFIEKYGTHYHPIGNTSKAELEFLDFVNSLEEGFEKTNHIIKKELDGYNDRLKIAFEYCGIFWHNEMYKPDNYHYEKYIECKNKGIRLLTIFEDEWIERKSQVKNFVRSLLNKNDKKYFARKLNISIINKRDISAINFLNDYHIQGCPNINNILCFFALKDNDDIISIMAFSRHHRNNVEVVLSRYCVKENCNVIGGSKRLLKHSLEYFKCDIKTWSDNRWTEGDMYKRLGFTLEKELPKDYSYVKNGKRLPKQTMKKSSIGADENQTEHERALELGFLRIWDCGKKTWIYKYN